MDNIDSILLDDNCLYCNEASGSKDKAVILDSTAIKYEEFYIHNKFLNFHILHYM